MNMPSFFSQLRGSIIPRLAAVALVALALGSGCASSANKYGSKINDAAASGNLSKTKALLKANPDLVFSKDQYGYTPLHEAAFMGRKDEAELLLANGADVNATNNFFETPLHVAASQGHKDAAEVLLASNADVNAKNNFGTTPLHLAACMGHKDVSELLLAHRAEVDIYDAAKIGNVEKVESLLKTNPGLMSSKDYKYGRTPLHWAALYGNKDAVESLLAKEANVNATDKDQMTPLHLVAENDQKEAGQLVLETAKLLLASNADVNAVNFPFGDTPLHKAAGGRVCCKEMAELLLANKADVNAQNGSGWTPLHVAASEGRKDVAELLLAHGADVNIKTYSGETALHWAADRGDKGMAELLLANGANVNATNNFGKTVLCFAKNSEFGGSKDVAKLLRQRGGHE
jgi:ankyrin repeat protein